MKTAYRLLTVAIVLAFASVACQKKTETAAAPAPAYEPPATAAPAAPMGARVERITVAKAVNSDDSPGEAASTFGKKDTVYVSMWTANAPVGTEIKARWMGPDGQQLNEDKIVTDRAGDGYTSFHAANTKGWASGTYRVEILLNGAPAGSTTFTVS
ncbi:MAG TPA: hypothetical protein VK389_00075 [Thermoanaerobaculia bacterium]|jgi:hypothetical protein|nr:hypothetical protein [Thermoanaerobaculia bacterium]